MLPSLKLQKTIGAGRVNDVAWSPQGDAIVVAQDFDILFYDSASLELIENVSFGGTEVVFSPDGMLVAIASDMNILIWNIEEKVIIQTFKTDIARIHHVIYNSDGNYLAVLGDSNVSHDPEYALEIWDVNLGELAISKQGYDSDANIAFSPDGETLAFVNVAGVNLIQVETGEEKLIELTWENGSLAYISDNVLLKRFDDSQLEIIDLRTSELLNLIGVNNRGFSEFKLSPDKKKIAFPSTWNEGENWYVTQVWDLETESLLYTLDFDSDVTRIDFSPDSKYFISADYDGYIRIHDLQTGELVRQLEFTSAVSALEFLPVKGGDSSYSIMAGYSEGQIRIWDSDEQLIREFADHNGQVNSIAFNTDYSKAISAANDDTVKIWDIATGFLIKTLDCSGGYNYALAAEFSYDEDFVVVECLAGKVEIWETNTWTQIDSIDGYDLQRLPHENILVSLFPLGDHGRFTVTGILDKEKIYEFSLADEYIVLNALFSPNGKRLAAVDGQNTVIVWDTDNKTPKYYLLEDGTECTYMECQQQSVAFSSDSSLLASSNEDQKLVRLWDMESGKQIMVLDLMNNVNVVAFSPDGRYLIAGCDDGRIYVWAIE